MRSRAFTVLIGSPVVTALRFQSRSSTTACMNSSVTRTELLAFWYWIEWLSLPSRSMSKPASRSARLALLDRLAPDELFDVGVVGVEDDHLRRAARLAARLDRAGRRVGAAHEAHRTRRGAAALEELLRRADVRQVDARAGAALEDRALFAVPVEDGVHRVVDREDETVVHPEVVAQVLTALGLDVVDVHLAERLDALDLEALHRNRVSPGTSNWLRACLP